MPTVEELATRVSSLSGAFEFWTNWSQALTAITAIAGLLYFGTSWIANRRALALGNAQADLRAAVDRKFALELSKQQERTAIAERRLEEVRQQAGPRRLTTIQRAALIERLRTAKGSLVIVSALQDADSSDFADDFDSALREAGWETLRIRNRLTTAIGVSLGWVTGTPEPLLLGVKQFSDLLTSLCITHTQVTFGTDDHSIDPAFRAGVAYLVIEHKPPLTINTNAKPE